MDPLVHNRDHCILLSVGAHAKAFILVVTLINFDATLYINFAPSFFNFSLYLFARL